MHQGVIFVSSVYITLKGNAMMICRHRTNTMYSFNCVGATLERKKKKTKKLSQINGKLHKISKGCFP